MWARECSNRTRQAVLSKRCIFSTSCIRGSFSTCPTARLLSVSSCHFPVLEQWMLHYRTSAVSHRSNPKTTFTFVLVPRLKIGEETEPEPDRGGVSIHYAADSQRSNDRIDRPSFAVTCVRRRLVESGQGYKGRKLAVGSCRKVERLLLP